jgi:hypothetical protein
MPVSVSLAVTPAAPAHGSTVTAAYTVTGDVPAAGAPILVTGSVTVGGVAYDVEATATPAGKPAPTVTYAVPAAPGLTFAATPAPNVFTAVVP